MTLLQLQILTTAVVILWFDVFGIHRIILKFKGLGPADDYKPFTCFFCMSWWLGVAMAIGSVCGSLTLSELIDWELIVTFVVQNFIVSIILDRVLGYESVKGK